NGKRPLIVVGRRISRGAREAFSQAGIGWADETGAAEIVFDQLIISKSGRPNETPEKPAKWTPAVLSVAEALLSGTTATVHATAAATGLSLTACTNALQTLTEFQLLTRSARRGPRSARHLADRLRLL